MKNRAPDSDFVNGIGDDRRIEIVPTEEFDFPSGGSVTIRLYYSRFQSSTLKITRAEAQSALEQLRALLAEQVSA